MAGATRYSGQCRVDGRTRGRGAARSRWDSLARRQRAVLWHGAWEARWSVLGVETGVDGVGGVRLNSGGAWRVQDGRPWGRAGRKAQSSGGSLVRPTMQGDQRARTR
jgi:hypothetical protein